MEVAVGFKKILPPKGKVGKFVPVVMVAEVAGMKHLLEYHGANLGIRLAEQFLFFQSQDVVHDEHHGGGELAHVQALDLGHDAFVYSGH